MDPVISSGGPNLPHPDVKKDLSKTIAYASEKHYHHQLIANPSL